MTKAWGKRGDLLDHTVGMTDVKSYWCQAPVAIWALEYSLEAKVSSSYPALPANPPLKIQFIVLHCTYLSCPTILNIFERAFTKTTCGFVWWKTRVASHFVSVVLVISLRSCILFDGESYMGLSCLCYCGAVSKSSLDIHFSKKSVGSAVLSCSNKSGGGDIKAFVRAEKTKCV